MVIWKQILIIAALVVAGAVAWMQLGGEAGGSSDPGDRSRMRPTTVYVLTEPAVASVSGERLRAVGTAEAQRTVRLYPEVAGQVAAVNFTSGEVVTEGQPLVQLDDADELLAVEAASIMLADATATVDRYGQLIGTGAVSAVVRDQAITAVDAATNDLARAQLELDRRTIVAPITGLVGIINLEPGDRVDTDTLITRIDDSAILVVDFAIPERFAGRVHVGQPISATTAAFPGQVLQGAVTALDSRLDAASRTLTVRAEIANDGLLQPGLAFAVELAFEGSTYPAVADIAIQWDRAGSYVWMVAQGQARRVSVTIMERRDGLVLLDGPLDIGDPVVVAGSQRLSDGTEVTLEPPGPTRPRPAPGQGAGG